MTDPRQPNDKRWWTSCGRSDRHKPHPICEHAGSKGDKCKRCLRPVSKVLMCHGLPFERKS